MAEKVIFKTPFLKELNLELPYDPAIPLLGMYPREMKTYVHTKTCMPVFTATLFVIAKMVKQPKPPSTNVVRPYNRIFFSHEKELQHG